MPENSLTPTGDCYSACAKFIIDKFLLERGDVGDLVLVHGRPTLTRPPHVKYGHAWIEMMGAVAYDVERDVAVPIALFYAAGEIDPEECFYYTAEDVRKMLLEYGHYGPWEGVEGCPPIPEEDRDECRETSEGDNAPAGRFDADDDGEAQEEGSSGVQR